MEKPQHTPAPWEIATYGGARTGRTFEVVNSHSESIATTHGTNEEANARLIAAAPELLKALEDLLWQAPYSEEKTIAPWFVNARAAIAKATGDK